MERKSPSKSATLYKVGTKKKGNDGNIWIIVEASNGVKRWQLHKKTSKKGSKKKQSVAVEIKNPIKGLREEKKTVVISFDAKIYLADNDGKVSKVSDVVPVTQRKQVFDKIKKFKIIEDLFGLSHYDNDTVHSEGTYIYPESLVDIKEALKYTNTTFIKGRPKYGENLSWHIWDNAHSLHDGAGDGYLSGNYIAYKTKDNNYEVVFDDLVFKVTVDGKTYTIKYDHYWRKS